MSQKKKNNPFEPVLNASEDILWISSQNQNWRDSFRTGPYRAYLLISSILMIVIGIALLANAGPKSPVTTPALIMLIVGAVILRLFGGSLFGMLFSGSLIPKARQTTLYAVTNERLLMMQGERIDGLPLEDVPLISVLPNGTRGTLSFGAVFPMWSVEDVKYVKSVIDQAKKERIKELNA